MQLYKKINIPQFEIIQQKLLTIAQKLLVAGKTDACLADQEQILSYIPELKKYLDDNKLNWEIARFFLTAPGDEIPIHIDGNELHPKFLAINIPIIGCNGTKMLWWDNVEITQIKDLKSYGAGIIFLEGSDKKIIDVLELDQPYVVRINLPHNVVNPTTHDRIILTMRFNPQPIDLWNSTQES